MKISKWIRYSLLVIGFLPAMIWAANERNAVTGGLYYGGPVAHTGAVIEYERRFKRSISLGLQAGGFSYDYKDGDFQEKGQRTGANLILRFSPGKREFQGFYLGGGLGYWTGYYDYVDPQDNPSSGHINTPSISFLATTGWRIPLADSQFYLDPRLTWGGFAEKNNDDNSLVRGFLSLGVNLGVRF